MDSDRVVLSPEDAEKMLPSGKEIHTFRQAGPAILGSDIKREKILEKFKTCNPELSGEQATKMKHGIVLKDETGYLFVETS